MTADSGDAGREDSVPTGNERPRSKQGFDIGRWLGLWFPVIVTGIGGLVMGTFFGLGSAVAWLAGSCWYSLAFAIIAGFCVFLPPFVVWRIMRWVQREIGNDAQPKPKPR